MQDEFEAYRAGIDRLLDRADEQLDAIERNRLHHAVKLRRGDWLGQVEDTAAEELGKRLIAQLGDADAELTDEQVAELEQLIYTSLPQFDEPRG